MAIDLRMQSARWINDLLERGGKVEIEDVNVKRLDEIAARNDLTIVAAGRNEMMKLFPRDEARSTYRSPQRYLAMVCFNGVNIGVPYAPWFSPIKFNFFERYGEMFWMPWFSKDRVPSLVCLFEAKTGGPLDRFRDCRSGADVLNRGREVVREIMPWDYEVFEKGEVCDEHSWLVGAFTPEVRHVVGTLPSGRQVMALGDTAHSLDPIGGQGANSEYDYAGLCRIDHRARRQAVRRGLDASVVRSFLGASSFLRCTQQHIARTADGARAPLAHRSIWQHRQT